MYEQPLNLQCSRSCEDQKKKTVTVEQSVDTVILSFKCQNLGLSSELQVVMWSYQTIVQVECQGPWASYSYFFHYWVFGGLYKRIFLTSKEQPKPENHFISFIFIVACQAHHHNTKSICSNHRLCYSWKQLDDQSQISVQRLFPGTASAKLPWLALVLMRSACPCHGLWRLYGLLNFPQPKRKTQNHNPTVTLWWWAEH